VWATRRAANHKVLLVLRGRWWADVDGYEGDRDGIGGEDVDVDVPEDRVIGGGRGKKFIVLEEAVSR
jgi:hypothetical protein